MSILHGSDKQATLPLSCGNLLKLQCDHAVVGTLMFDVGCCNENNSECEQVHVHK